MPSTSIGVYPGSLTAVENDQVSSTGEGRHLTFYETDITGKEGTYAEKGHPVVVGEHIVGVAFKTGTVANELIAIDTEGIWNLMVYPKDDLGAIDVVAGDELWINKTTAEISKMRNSVTHTRFGYALGGVTTVVGNEVIAVKVHWDGDDEIEQIGLTGAPFVSDEASRVFRSYFYDAGGGGLIEGSRMELTITASAVTACVDYRKLIFSNDPTVITGRASVIEARLEITDAGVLNLPTMANLVLDYLNPGSSAPTNFAASYLALRDRSAAAYQMNNLINFMDVVPSAANPDKLFVASTDTGSTHRIKFLAGPAYYWIMCTTTAPA